MKQKLLPKKICHLCLCTYQPNAINQKFCNDCLEHRPGEIRRYRHKIQEKKNIIENNEYYGMRGIHTVNSEVEEYNKKHGTSLTYGKYLHAKTYGLLEE